MEPVTLFFSYPNPPFFFSCFLHFLHNWTLFHLLGLVFDLIGVLSSLYMPSLVFFTGKLFFSFYSMLPLLRNLSTTTCFSSPGCSLSLLSIFCLCVWLVLFFIFFRRFTHYCSKFFYLLFACFSKVTVHVCFFFLFPFGLWNFNTPIYCFLSLLLISYYYTVLFLFLFLFYQKIYPLHHILLQLLITPLLSLNIQIPLVLFLPNLSTVLINLSALVELESQPIAPLQQTSATLSHLEW